jgi:hypothetical protein
LGGHLPVAKRRITEWVIQPTCPSPTPRQDDPKRLGADMTLTTVSDPAGGTSRKGNLRTLRTAEPGSGRPERAEAAFGHSLIGVP